MLQLQLSRIKGLLALAHEESARDQREAGYNKLCCVHAAGAMVTVRVLDSPAISLST